tara:strand:+ start:658 stop:942 length:285 start_codon:yes stop_codon:yes gene_type:complete
MNQGFPKLVFPVDFDVIPFGYTGRFFDECVHVFKRQCSTQGQSASTISPKAPPPSEIIRALVNTQFGVFLAVAPHHVITTSVDRGIQKSLACST